MSAADSQTPAPKGVGKLKGDCGKGPKGDDMKGWTKGGKKGKDDFEKGKSS